MPSNWQKGWGQISWKSSAKKIRFKPSSIGNHNNYKNSLVNLRWTNEMRLLQRGWNSSDSFSIEDGRFKKEWRKRSRRRKSKKLFRQSQDLSRPLWLTKLMCERQRKCIWLVIWCFSKTWTLTTKIMAFRGPCQKSVNKPRHFGRLCQSRRKIIGEIKRISWIRLKIVLCKLPSSQKSVRNLNLTSLSKMEVLLKLLRLR